MHWNETLVCGDSKTQCGVWTTRLLCCSALSPVKTLWSWKRVVSRRDGQHKPLLAEMDSLKPWCLQLECAKMLKESAALRGVRNTFPCKNNPPVRHWGQLTTTRPAAVQPASDLHSETTDTRTASFFARVYCSTAAQTRWRLCLIKALLLKIKMTEVTTSC